MTAQAMFSAENEHCVIGALLRDNNAVDFIGALKAEHFFLDDCRKLFAAAMRMIAAGRGCDAVTLAEELFDRNDGDDWLPIIGDMVANTPSSRNIGRYAQIVIDRATERSLVVASDTIAMIAGGILPTAEKVDKAQATVMALADGLPAKEARDISSILADVVQAVQDGLEGTVVRNLSGWTDVDSRADLLTPGDLIIVAARPAMGKTTFAMNLAEHVAAEKPVVVFSQEMGDTQLGTRLVAAVGRVQLERLTRHQNQLTDDDLSRMAMAADRISKFQMHIDDQPARSLHQIRTYCRAVKRKHGDLGLVVIDYLQLMTATEGDNRTEQIGSISRGLKVLAKELSVPVIALSQLNRSLEQRPNKRPIMSDLRESGQIEQDADVIAFIYRDEVYNPDTSDKGVAEIIFGKLRNGQIGTVALAFNGEFSRFDNLAHAWAPAPAAEKKSRGFKS